MNMNIFGFHFLDKYKYIWAYQKWANSNTNTIIGTDSCKYEYNYEYHRTKKNVFIDMKAIKVWQLMHICAIKYN